MYAEFIQFDGLDRKTLVSVVAAMGSLCTGPYWERPWKPLLDALRAEEGSVALATEVTVAAVPEEGSPDPRRAVVLPEKCSEAWCGFLTPGGVVVMIGAGYDEAEEAFTLQVMFGRESHALVRELLHRVCLEGRHEVQVQLNNYAGCTLPQLHGPAGGVLGVLLLADAEGRLAPALASLGGVEYRDPVA